MSFPEPFVSNAVCRVPSRRRTPGSRWTTRDPKYRKTPPPSWVLLPTTSTRPLPLVLRLIPLSLLSSRPPSPLLLSPTPSISSPVLIFPGVLTEFYLRRAFQGSLYEPLSIDEGRRAQVVEVVGPAPLTPRPTRGPIHRTPSTLV